MDGTCERWEIELDSGLFLYLDCNIPSPWGTSEKYFGTVSIFGYRIGEEIYLETN